MARPAHEFALIVATCERDFVLTTNQDIRVRLVTEMICDEVTYNGGPVLTFVNPVRSTIIGRRRDNTVQLFHTNDMPVCTLMSR